MNLLDQFTLSKEEYTDKQATEFSEKSEIFVEENDRSLFAVLDAVLSGNHGYPGISENQFVLTRMLAKGYPELAEQVNQMKIKGALKYAVTTLKGKSKPKDFYVRQLPPKNLKGTIEEIRQKEKLEKNLTLEKKMAIMEYYEVADWNEFFEINQNEILYGDVNNESETKISSRKRKGKRPK